MAIQMMETDLTLEAEEDMGLPNGELTTPGLSVQQEGQPEPQSMSLPGLNSEQSKQLLRFLTNLTGSSQQKPSELDTIGAHMAGILTPAITIYNSDADQNYHSS